MKKLILKDVFDERQAKGRFIDSSLESKLYHTGQISNYSSCLTAFIDEPEIDRVKRYFIGKGLQKVWKRINESGRTRIIRQYATIEIIITEEEVEEPPEGDDDSIPSQPMDPEHDYLPVYFEFKLEICRDDEEDHSSDLFEPVDLSVFEPDRFPALEEAETAVYLYEYFILLSTKPIDADSDYYEYCRDDTWSKVILY